MSRVCRICFEGNDSGTLYNPCFCSGSVKYIHEHCLFRWIDTKLDNTNSCEICKTPYRIRYNQTREHEIDERIIRGNILINPSAHVLVYCMLLLRINAVMPPPTFESQFNPNTVVDLNLRTLLWNLLLYHITYIAIGVLYIEFTVYNRGQYYQKLLSIRYGGAVIFHAFLWGYILWVYSIDRLTTLLVFTAIQCYLSVYPMIHFRIIHDINDGRRRIAINM
jgi:hypothetical protein